MEAHRSAVVVGAGIGGLAAAGALAAAGWRVVVLERAEEVRPLGSGLALWKNALTALDILTPALAAKLRTRPRLTGPAGLRFPDGRWVLRVDSGDRGPELLPVMVERPELFAGLRATVPEDAFRFGRTATRVEAGRVLATTALGEQEEYAADLVVAADGMGSRVRAAVDDLPRVTSAGYLAWRGIVPAEPAEAVGLLDGGETWGRGQRFGMNTLSDGGIYWYATLAEADPRAVDLSSSPPAGADGDDGADAGADDAAGGRGADRGAGGHGADSGDGAAPAFDGATGGPDGAGARDEQRRLLELFAGWHPPIAALIGATPPHLLLRHQTPMLWPLPRTYASGMVALLGDAAHGMTPDLGQGACLALEDAVELAAVLGHAAPADVPAALRRYDTLRRPRTTKLAKRARLMSVVAQARHPLGAAVRDRLLRLVPAGAVAGALDDVLRWQPSAPGTVTSS